MRESQLSESGKVPVRETVVKRICPVGEEMRIATGVSGYCETAAARSWQPRSKASWTVKEGKRMVSCS